MKIAIGSENPVKLKAVEKAIRKRFPEHCDFVFKKVASGVSNQPFGDETMEGARNRAQNVRLEFDADYGVGLEGGIDLRQGLPFAVAWCAIVDRQGKVSYGSSFGVPLPAVLMRRIEQGMELGDAMDELFNTKNIKHREGFFGFATGNLVTREAGYYDMVLAALATFTLPEYYRR